MMFPAFRPSRRTLVVGSCAVVASLSACSTLPRDTQPEVLYSFEAAPDAQPSVGPQPGQEPDLLLRSFYTAAAIPAGDYEAARSFLTPQAAESWNPQGDVLLVDAIDLTTVANSSEGDRRTFAVRGSVIGSLAGGLYTPQMGSYEAEIVMRQVDGEWRIADLPAGVVIERTELRNQYQPQALYFFDRTGRALVKDRRWLFSGQNSLGVELITLLMQGPNRDLAPATRTVIPNGAEFVGVDEGVYTFTGFNELSQDDRRLIGAQIVWTLSNAGVPGPYRIEADSTNLVDGLDELTTDDFADLNPQVPANTVAPLYAVNDGRILRVTGNSAVPIDGPLGSADNIQSADVSAEGTVAAVRSVGDEYRLEFGDVDGQLTRSLTGRTLSRPTFEIGGQAAWTVVDGDTVVRVVRSSSGELAEMEVNTSALDDIEGEISVLRLSNTGARVAMIIGGKIYTGMVERTPAGDVRIVNVREFAPELSGTALTLDWHPDGSIAVGTSAQESPVWRVEQDGSSVSALPSGNVTAPVVAIAASPSTVYITDTRAMLQMPASESDTAFWREVPGLQGVRSAPIVAN